MNHYVIADACLYLAGKKIIVEKVMVSEAGIWRVLGTANDQAFMPNIISVEILGKQFKGSLIREAGKDCLHYNLRFVSLGDEQRSYLQEIIQAQGKPPPWRREYPRLIISDAMGDAEIPSSAMLQRGTGQALAEVMNFTLNGILLEFISSGLALNERVGDKVDFDLQTNSGRRLTGLQGEIARIYDEQLGYQKFVRGLGMRLLPISGKNNILYRELIQNYCKMVKRSS